MLDIALNHVEELKKKFAATWFDEKYKFYNYDTYYSDFEVSSETWDNHQFVSLDKEGNILGYIGYSINRQTYNCYALGIINFSDNKIVFGMDVGYALTDIFEKFKFNKLRFSVIIGNPIEKTYDKIIQKYGGRIVGVYEKETKLIDGEYYDEKIYEITLNNYLKEKFRDTDKKLYNCNKKVIYPPSHFINCNCSDNYKESITVDACIADEIETLWYKGIKTTGCCCGHGLELGFIQVTDDCISEMEKLGYEHYIYNNEFGGIDRKDAFIPKSYGHIYSGYSDGYLG